MIRYFRIILGLSKRLASDKRGAAYVYMAILLPAFLGFVGLGIDVGLWQVTKRDTQIIADAAAVAGALEGMRFTDIEGDPEPNTAALSAAALNGLDTAGSADGIIVNIPPTSGPMTGVAGAIEVIVDREAPMFLSLLFKSTATIVRSRAVATAGTGNNCIRALSPDDSGAIKVTGTSDVVVNCGVRADSDDEEAITVVGGGCLTASEEDGVEIVGSGSGCISPEPVTDVPYSDDPLKSMPEPDLGPCTFTQKFNITSGTHDFIAGVYCGDITINTSVPVTFGPGIYELRASSFNITAQSIVTGSELMFYLTPQKTPDNISFAGGAHITLSAMSSGVYQGILFFESRDTTRKISHNFTGGTFQDLNGILYFPNSDVKYAGGADGDSGGISIIAYTIDFNGETTIGAIPPGTDPGLIVPFSRFLIVVNLVE